MKDFYYLVKAVQANSLVTNRKKKNGKSVRPHTFSLSALLSGIIIALSVTFEFFTFIMGSREAGLSLGDYTDYIQLSLSSYFIYGFFFSLLFSSSIFFKGNNDCFLSLPISGNRLFLAKLALSFYINLIYGGLSILAVSITTCVLFHLGFLSYLSAILIFLLYLITTPCLSFVIVNFLAGFLNFKDGRWTNTLFSTVCAILAIAGILSMSMINTVIPEEVTKDILTESIQGYTAAFRWISWLGYLPTKGLILSGSMDSLSLLYLLLISAGIVSLTLLLSRRSYITNLGRTYSRHRKTISREENEKNIQKDAFLLSHPFKVKIRREFSNFRQEQGMYLHALMMPLYFILLFATMLYSLRFTTDMEPSILRMMALTSLNFSLYFFFLPYASVSLERKNYVQLKTFPMDMSHVILYKLIPCFIIYYPSSLVLLVLELFAVPLTPSFVLAMMAIALFYPMLDILFSFYMGVCFPNFNYEGIQDLTKKGWGVTLCHIFHIIFTMVSFALLFVSQYLFQNYYLGIGLLIVFYLGLSITFFILSKARLKKLLNTDFTF